MTDTRQSELSSRLSYEPVTQSNLSRFKHVTACLFPVSYPPSFYKRVANQEIRAFLVRESERYIGCLSWLPRSAQDPDSSAELLTFGVLVLYRCMGIGTHMLQFVQQHLEPGTKELTLCVHVNNEDAIRFYQKQGFQLEHTRKNYYARLDPPDAYKMRKTMSHSP